ncbi:MAG: methyltransferase domain-containing protein [Lentisphaerae bacterium]|nr:methyltransferase domain-containing protein [Lentisphaerota bacterium]
MTTTHQDEVNAGRRFEFGKNWTAFLSVLDEDRIRIAEESLKTLLGESSLSGQRFLDIGSGSGLFSLCARRLGADVVSMDYDPKSVACTRELKRRYFPEDPCWAVHEGSVLDESFMERLGSFGIVYSWGVLHHTGRMMDALEAAGRRVRAPGGKLAIAIYNDQGAWSRRWRAIKKMYCANRVSRALVTALGCSYFALQGAKEDLLQMRNPLARYGEYRRNRGMAIWTDWIDWLGGLPFEVAKPEVLFDFYAARGFRLIRLTTCGGSLGNNEFVFVREHD